MAFNHPARKSPKTGAVIFILLIMITFLFYFTTTAQAHSSLEKISPSEGEVLTASPSQADLWFKGAVELYSSSISVKNESGQDVQKGTAYLDKKDGKHVVVPLQQNLSNGTYTVKANVLSLDGHTLKEEYSFIVHVPPPVEDEKSKPEEPDVSNEEETFKLVNSSPQDGLILQSSPKEIELWFNQPVIVHQGTIMLFNDQREKVKVGISKADPDNPRHVIVESLSNLAPGTYMMNWFVTSVKDNKMYVGTYYFAVDKITVLAPVQGIPTNTVLSVVEGVDFPQWLSYIGVLILFGVSWFTRVISPQTGLSTRWINVSRLLFGLSILGLTGQIGFTWSNIPNATWIDIILFRIGWVPLVQIGLLSLAFWLQKGKASLVIYGITIMLFSLTGHSFSYGGPIFIIINTIHLLAVSIWMGGLTALMFNTPTEGIFNELKRPGKLYSKWALWAVVVIIATGFAMTIDFTSSWLGVFYSVWGKYIWIKVALLALVVILGFIQMKSLNDMNEHRTTPFFHRVKVELIIGSLILFAAAVLVDLSPLAADKGITPEKAIVQGIEARLEMDPIVVGRNVVTVDFASNQHFKEVIMNFSMPPNLDGIESRAFDLGSGQYQVQGDQFTYPGTWYVNVIAARENGEEVVFPFEVLIPEEQ
jgi:copper transport protein